MIEDQSPTTRAVSLTKDDLRDLRSKLEGNSFDVKERELVQYLTEQAEMGLDNAGDSVPLWTWTYRF